MVQFVEYVVLMCPMVEMAGLDTNTWQEACNSHVSREGRCMGHVSRRKHCSRNFDETLELRQDLINMITPRSTRSARNLFNGVGGSLTGDLGWLIPSRQLVTWKWNRFVTAKA
jgi:hypothetical protein